MSNATTAADLDSAPFSLPQPRLLPAKPFTRENARELQARSVAKRKANRDAAALAAAIPVTPQAINSDPFAIQILSVCNETLQKIRESRSAKNSMYYAKALRDLRETYHMVTGTPKPAFSKVGTMPAKATAPLPPPVPSSAVLPSPATDIAQDASPKP